ncbi:hypothetical protein A2154_01880 [Candidatus Gottesmanbacteria bacterium RBG_16_43_7]|uniref:ADP-dependent (S)-NAD(P)H-hydrate dehydratase n=1 Tax=Candidatus Gottesmanbacteria bacterium RBG_16_43_7 TaxID=1798373 RepID=A0A1F5Z8L4_9BACT|nr:MAG: hypothetical protein A2154_01880 [Candidatus Gottesmanbacteria bacterium RBG_16_43_7]
MQPVDQSVIKKLYIPPADSHKGQNGRLLIIGGSHLFHAASIWALTVASRIVDLVHYCSVEENNQLVTRLKNEFRNGIVLERKDVERYIVEDDCILIGPGMPRIENSKQKTQNSKLQLKSQNLNSVLALEDEGEQTGALTNYLLSKYQQKRWVIDAGALQMVDPKLIPNHSVLTPHLGEFIGAFKDDLSKAAEDAGQNFFDPLLAHEISSFLHNLKSHSLGKRSAKILSLASRQAAALYIAQKYNCTLLLKGQEDVVCNLSECQVITGGNAGMTKGGTGDVLAGLVAALACKNDPFLSAVAGSFINKKAGDELYQKVGPYFNASDLAGQLPLTMGRLMSV